ncbi:hypothetical protein KVT40_003002 [Elsinoe batatas]|uniref:Uncharacterized protein n=1 Tax=Elsinoe batatas TaxID=2601811 RepID=A0A8K0L4Q3_9PEZI|nr:hypothetical protein KVT40_003002 [Elsinoe batatas]
MIRHEFTTVRITVSYGHAPRAGFFLNVTDERINKDCDDEPKFKGLCDSLFSDGDGVYLDVHTGTDTAWKKVSLAVMREIWRRYGVNPVAMRLLDWEDAEPRE